MEGGKGNIMNRPVKSNIRDKNFSYQQNEEKKANMQESYKLQKMQQIQEHRAKALNGNKQERLQVTKMY